MSTDLPVPQAGTCVKCGEILRTLKVPDGLPMTVADRYQIRQQILCGFCFIVEFAKDHWQGSE